MNTYRLPAISIAFLFLSACHSPSNNHHHEHEDDHGEDVEIHETEIETRQGGNHETGHLKDDSDSHNGEHPEGEIKFTCEQAKEADLMVEEVKKAPFYQVIKAGGQLQSTANDDATVVATTSGILSFTGSPIVEGKQVSQGETMAYVSSQGVADGDQLKKQKVEADIAKNEFERIKSLYTDKLVTRKEYDEAKQRYETAKISYGSLSDKQTEKGTKITASITGYVKTILVSEGSYVEVGTPIMVITKNKTIQLTADVPERYYRDLKSVKTANFKVCYDEKIYELDKLGGQVLSYGKNVVNGSGTIPISFVFDNKGSFVAGSYAEVYLLGEKRENVMSVPIASLYEAQGLYFVFVRHQNECFIRKEVKLGQNNGDRVEIMSGLNEGDWVVVNGTVQVRLASNSSVIPAHSHHH